MNSSTSGMPIRRIVAAFLLMAALAACTPQQGASAPLPTSGVSTLPNTSVLVRTWFADDSAWDALLAQVSTPTKDGFLASVDDINDPAFEGLTAEGLVAEALKSAALEGDQSNGAIVSFIADELTLTRSDHPILAVWVLPLPADEDRPEPKPFRVVPSELWTVENNINDANMDWEDFTSTMGEGGVFRGF